MAFKGLCDHIKTVLGDKIEKCNVGFRLNESPCVLVTSEWGWSANMERIMKAQALRDPSMSSYMVSKKTMEINPDHSIVLQLKAKIDADSSDRTIRDLIWLSFDTAMLTSGFSLDDPNAFATRIHRMVKFALSIGDNEKVDEAPELEETQISDDTAMKMEQID